MYQRWEFIKKDIKNKNIVDKVLKQPRQSKLDIDYIEKDFISKEKDDFEI